jgi:hypothetical protein
MTANFGLMGGLRRHTAWVTVRQIALGLVIIGVLVPVAGPVQIGGVIKAPPADIVVQPNPLIDPPDVG